MATKDTTEEEDSRQGDTNQALIDIAELLRSGRAVKWNRLSRARFLAYFNGRDEDYEPIKAHVVDRINALDLKHLDFHLIRNLEPLDALADELVDQSKFGLLDGVLDGSKWNIDKPEWVNEGNTRKVLKSFILKAKRACTEDQNNEQSGESDEADETDETDEPFQGWHVTEGTWAETLEKSGRSKDGLWRRIPPKTR